MIHNLSDVLARLAEPIEWNEEVFSESLADAVRQHDHNQANRLVEAFARHATHRRDPYPPDYANRDSVALRQERQFKLMRGFGDAVLATGTKDEKVRRQYAQSLIEQKAYARALEVLASIVGDPNPRPSEVAEAQGLIGRTFKQQYVDDPRAPGADALLRRAIEAYESVYKADSTQLWHGVNAASSILRAHRDGVTGVEPNRAREIAERVLEHFEVLERSGELGVWDYASREEALLALEDYDVAAAALDAYITHPDMHAFEVSSTYRQFDQVLRLGEDPRGRPILDRLWEAVERYRAGGLSSRPSPPSDHSESVTAETVGRPLLIRVADPDWQPERVPNLVLQARLGTIVSAQGSDASVKQLLKDPDVISVDESLPAGVGDCDKSVPFIGVAANYPGPGGEYSEKGDAALIAVMMASTCSTRHSSMRRANPALRRFGTKPIKRGLRPAASTWAPTTPRPTLPATSGTRPCRRAWDETGRDMAPMSRASPRAVR